MLSLPSIGIIRSVQQNNVDRIILGDWIEACALFGDGWISRSEIVDVLLEENICDDQDLAHQIAEDGWSEINMRLRIAAEPASLSVEADRVVRSGEWYEDLPRSFMLIVSLAKLYPDWAYEYKDYINQGHLFERLVEAACGTIFSGWSIHRVGWSNASNKSIEVVVRELCELLGTRGCPNSAEWIGDHAKDAQLDIICCRQFLDARECVPVYLLQCASGANWLKKLKEPDSEVWRRLLDAAFRPTRVLVIPFVINAADMRRHGVRVEGPLLDRSRLLSALLRTENWLPPDLVEDLRGWLDPRIRSLVTLHAA